MSRRSGLTRHLQSDVSAAVPTSAIGEQIEWAFHPIFLRHPGKVGGSPLTARIAIENSLFGFTVRHFTHERPGGHTTSFCSLNDAILEAGRLLHDLLADGYVISAEVSG